MTAERRIHDLLALAALAAWGASCGGSALTQSQAPVLVVIDSLQGAPGNHNTQFGNPLNSSVITNVTTPAPCTPATPCPTVFNDVGQVIMHLVLKDIGSPTSPTVATALNAVTITRYHIDYIRSDGLNTQGVNVPYSIDGAVTGTVPPTGQGTFGFESVQIVAKEQSPLVQLLGTGTVLSCLASVTFYGADQTGHAISVNGSFQIEFGSFANN